MSSASAPLAACPTVTPAAASSPSRALVVVCCLAQLLVMMDVSIVNVALPSMGAELGLPARQLPWVVTAYTLTFAGFLLVGGRAGDLLGRGPVFVSGLGVFAVAAVVGGVAYGPGLLIGARAAQGLAAAFVAPTSLALLTAAFPPGSQRNRALGLWGAMGGLGGASGALTGGAVTATASWRWVFLGVVPVVMALFVAALRATRPSSSPSSPRTPSSGLRSLDLPGAAAVSAGLVLLTYAVTGLGQSRGAAPAVAAIAGALLIAVFVLVEVRVASAPLVPLAALRSRVLVGACVTVCWLGGTVFSMWFLLTIYLQQVMVLTPLQTGLAFAPMSLIIMGGTRLASWLCTRIGPGLVLTVGMVVLAAGLLLLAAGVDTGSGLAGVILPSAVCALGISGCFVPATIAAQAEAPADQAGLTSGLLTTANQIGASIGLAAVGTILVSRSAVTGAASSAAAAQALVAGARTGFVVAATLAMIGALTAALFLLRREPTARRTR